ncbi:MAG: GFA family protein [Minwuia sp.]|nr:GFA family protein [Minwuia sp.]
MSEMALSGGCLCGAVRYTTRSEKPHASVCHCRMCQRWNGAPFFMAFSVRATEITWQGQPVEWRSSDIAVRSHCGACGTPLYWKGDREPEYFDIALMTLDDPSVLTPVDQIWSTAAAHWPGILPDLTAWPREEREGEPFVRGSD